ncbi:MAG: ABC transporter ATP-binding protein [Pseudomonadota bacterium]
MTSTAPLAVSLTGTARTGDLPLFGPLSLTLEAGAWTCLLGASGAGKTTILRLIAGLETGVDFDGRIDAADGAPLDGRIALMAQTDLLMPWLDVTGNVLLGHRLRGGAKAEATDRARDLIERVGLADHSDKRPHALSGGMRQRAALARTLMEDRPLVLLDEPFSALDARTRAEMQELAFELLEGRTVLLVTHDPAEAARLGHAIHVLDGGALILIAPPDAPPIRAYDDPAVFACQNAMMALLRRAA